MLYNRVLLARWKKLWMPVTASARRHPASLLSPSRLVQRV